MLKQRRLRAVPTSGGSRCRRKMQIRAQSCRRKGFSGHGFATLPVSAKEHHEGIWSGSTCSSIQEEVADVLWLRQVACESCLSGLVVLWVRFAWSTRTTAATMLQALKDKAESTREHAVAASTAVPVNSAPGFFISKSDLGRWQHRCRS